MGAIGEREKIIILVLFWNRTKIYALEEHSFTFKLRKLLFTSFVKNTRDKNIDHIPLLLPTLKGRKNVAPLTEGIVFFSKSVTVFNLTIYNSLLLLPQSLSKLAKAFGVSGKLDFDVFENDNADLFNTDFREKLLEYNKQDCKVLYDVILAFNNIFKDLFKLSTLESSTLPSLAYKLFSKTFLKHELELTFSERYVDYKEAYRGGAVDVYRPHGYNLFCYDVNSLYPYVMQSKPYPVGYSEYFWGNILSLSEIFGIVKCNIIAPDIYAPILLTKTVDDKVIAPIGS